MTSQTLNVLILCTGNSARSILGEVLVSAQPGLQGFSAGSTPKGAPHKVALQVLAERGHDVSGLASKSWDVFAGADAPVMDVIITVCDNAAGETCPYWPGHPVQAHWGLPDPAAIADGPDQRAAFEATYAALAERLAALAALPLAGMAPGERKAAVQAIHNRP